MNSQNRFLLLILAAIVLGAFFGGLFPDSALHVGFLGRLFLNALKMIVIPLVITSMVCGVANLGDVRKLGGVGKRTVLYYMATTGLSVLVGLALVNIVRPGVDIQRGEDLAGVPYAVEGNHLRLGGAALKRADYDARHQVILLDQDIAGILDPDAARGPNHLAVKSWQSRTGEAEASPRTTGIGLRIDLVVAEKVKGKDRSVLEVLVDVLIGMVPTNIFKAMAETDVLPVIAFSLLFGGVLTTLGDRGRPVLEVMAGLNDIIMKMVHIIITFAPVGIFGLIADRMGQSGGWAGFLPELVKVGWYALTVISGLLIHGVITLPRGIEECYHGPFLGARIPIYLEHFLWQGEALKEIVDEMGLDWDMSDYHPLSDWMPCQSYDAIQEGEYDLIAVHFKFPYVYGSYGNENPWVDEICEHTDAYNILLNETVGIKKGIKDGDLVWLESPVEKLRARVKLTQCIHPEAVGVGGHFGHVSPGMPIARGKGINFNSLLPTDLDHIDKVSTALDQCVQVKIYK